MNILLGSEDLPGSKVAAAHEKGIKKMKIKAKGDKKRSYSSLTEY